MKCFFVLHRLVFDDIGYFFVQHQHVSVETKLLFVQRQTFYYNSKLFFVQHQMFICVICLFDTFLLSHSNKNIITSQKMYKLAFLCDTKKINFVFRASPFFLYSVFTLHIVIMLIFFVVVLETKKLLTFFYSPV